MQRLCPKCQSWFSGQQICPRCNVQLLDPSRENAVPRLFQTKNPLATPITAWGRIILGTLLAQGLVLGIRYLADAWLLSQGQADEDISWLAPIFQFVGVALGALLVGAGYLRPLPLGMAFGGLNALVFLIVRIALQEKIAADSLINLAIAMMLFSAIIARIGGTIWRAFPPLQLAVPIAIDITPRANEPGQLPASFRISWERIILGSMVAAMGSYFAADIWKALIDSSRGSIQPANQLQSQFIAWELAMVAIVLGGAFAGMNTRIGMRQGVLCGALAGLFLITTYFVRGEGSYSSFEFWFEIFGWNRQRSDGVPPQLALLLFSNGLFFGTLGGWMGAALLPPIVKRRRSRRYY